MSMQPGFAVWMTGIPASGKSSLTRALAGTLRDEGISVVVLESDEIRKILTPEPTYSTEERDAFYRTLALLGHMITESGVNVIYDATANKRAYRDRARSLIRKFIEVYVHCPVEICILRDPKGIYQRAAAGTASNVPGVQTEYEPPLDPELSLDGQASPDVGVDVIRRRIKELWHI